MKVKKVFDDFVNFGRPILTMIAGGLILGQAIQLSSASAAPVADQALKIAKKAKQVNTVQAKALVTHQGQIDHLLNGLAQLAGSIGASINVTSDGVIEVRTNGNGAVGAAGPTGPQGPQGPAGVQGPAGAAGAAGPRGLAGINGQNGADGQMGPAGPIGPIGPAGAPGMNGANGAMGATGATGPAGPNIMPTVTVVQGPVSAVCPTGSTRLSCSGACTSPYTLVAAMPLDGNSQVCLATCSGGTPFAWAFCAQY
jgi:hypothetical protein